jgi:3-oxoacyl-[acyl-carrier protein] reductase
MSAIESDLAGSTAVVTGSSSGIGRAIAIELAAAGAKVVVHARRSRAAAEEVVASIGASGGHAELVMADLAETAALGELVAGVWRQGPVDIWINNAGADVLTGEAAKWPFERKLEELWRVDVAATMVLSREIGARMRQRGTGVILNIGWDQVEHGMAGDSGELFAATKGAVMAFSRSLALSLAPQVRVNCIAPGWIRTAWGNRASEAWQARARRESQLDRWGTPEEVAKVARFLVSPAASFINAQVVAVNGGFKPA